MTRVVTFLLVAATAACNSATVDASASPEQELAEARARWDSHGIRDYTIQLTRMNPLLYQPRVELTVLGDRRSAIVAVQPDSAELAGPSPLHVPEHWDDDPFLWSSVNGLFGIIERGIQSDGAVEAEFDEEYGYPTRIFWDPWPNAIDDEVFYTARHLVVLARDSAR